MLTSPQKSLLKRAQRQAGLPDDEYREALELITGFQSSRHPDFSNRQLDTVLAYFEAIYWRKVDSKILTADCRRSAVFLQRGYWAGKNTNLQNSRDRYRGQDLGQSIADLEGKLNTLGFGRPYCDAIRAKVTHGRRDERGQHLYCAALKRTLAAKEKAAAKAENPF